MEIKSDFKKSSTAGRLVVSKREETSLELNTTMD